MKRMEQRGIFHSMVFEIWQWIHAIIDNVINWCFSHFVYDDNKIYRLTKVKDAFLFDSASVLAEKIRNRELTAEHVVLCYTHRINSTNTIIRSMVDNRFEDALKEAREIDIMLEENKISKEELAKTKPLLGVPFTTKESTACKGLSYTFGLLSRKGIKAEEDAEVVRKMRAAGAVLLGVSNIPELNLWCETRNHIYGQSNNPYNTNRTVGGSSGGEATLVTACASPVGIGTDIGGSIRMPAFYVGVFGHKPTTGVVSMKGTTRRDGTENPTMVAAGPITRKAEDLLPVLKVIAKSEILPKLKLDEPVNIKKLRFFYMEESGDYRASPMCNDLKQALRKTVHHLQELTGKPAERLDLEGTRYSYPLWRYWMSKEPYQFDEELGNRERKVSIWQELPKKLLGYSEFTIAAILKLIDCQILPAVPSKWAEDQTEKLRKELLDYLGDDGVLIYPSHPFPASFHYSSLFRPFNIGYWAIFNVLNLPATQVPLGLNKDGLPLGVQVVSNLHNDRICLEVACELERAFGGWVSGFSS